MLTAALVLVLASLQTAELDGAAWEAAMQLKQKSAYRDAAAAFERFAAERTQSPRAAEARLEAGVCHFSAGRSALELYRMTPQAQEEFARALELFAAVAREQPSSPLSSRASYMQGSTYYFSGELEAAEAAYQDVLERFSADRNYVAKALERRAFVRRHLLRPGEAIADLERWIANYAGSQPNADTVAKELALARTLGQPAPRIVPESWPAGPPAPLEAQRGHVVALCFFATWCPNCAKELPFLLDLERRFGPRDVRFIGVMDHSKGQTAEAVGKFAVDNALRFSVMLDGGAASRGYQVGTIPHLVLIDRDGRIRWRDNPSNLADWTLEHLLAEGSEAAKR